MARLDAVSTSDEKQCRRFLAASESYVEKLEVMIDPFESSAKAAGDMPSKLTPRVAIVIVMAFFISSSSYRLSRLYFWKA